MAKRKVKTTPRMTIGTQSLLSVVNMIPTSVMEEGEAEGSALAGPLAEVQLSSSKSLTSER
jgi:hypothetical protein